MKTECIRPMALSQTGKSLLVAAYFRGGSPDDQGWGSNCDQVITLSLFYTGDISFEECSERFSQRRYVGGLYQNGGELDKSVKRRYRALLKLLRRWPEFIEGAGDLKRPADPTYTSCRLTVAGQKLALMFMPEFRRKPEFPNWPDRRTVMQG